jgi:LAO/AO transport system kinase
MVDVFLVLLLASSGDELQGIKRGILELADLIAINKSDAESPAAVNRALADYRNALRIVRGTDESGVTRVLRCSGLTGEGVDTIWEAMLRVQQGKDGSNAFAARRAQQLVSWLWSTVDSTLLSSLRESPGVVAIRDEVEAEVRAGRLTPTLAAHRLLEAYRLDRALR